jgi:hypothetical protein
MPWGSWFLANGAWLLCKFDTRSQARNFRNTAYRWSPIFRITAAGIPKPTTKPKKDSPK